MGIGTSLVNFANSLSGTIAVAVFAVAYNASTSADPTNVALIQNGVKSVFWTAAVVTLIGLLLVIFIVKPEMSKKAAEMQIAFQKIKSIIRNSEKKKGRHISVFL